MDWSIDRCSKLASNRFSEDLLGVSSEDVYTDLGTRQSTEDETGETCRSILQHVLPKLFSLEEPVKDCVMDNSHVRVCLSRCFTKVQTGRTILR